MMNGIYAKHEKHVMNEKHVTLCFAKASKMLQV